MIVLTRTRLKTIPQNRN